MVFRIFFTLECGLLLGMLGYVVKGMRNGTLNGGTVLPWLIALAVPLVLAGLAFEARQKGLGGRSGILLSLALPASLVSLLALHLMSWAGRWS